MKNLVKENNDVYYTTENIVSVNKDTLDLLCNSMFEHRSDKIRLCAHETKEDVIHEMLIIHTRDKYVRPHKHINKEESFHLITGEVMLLLFEDDGTLNDAILLSTINKNNSFYYHISEPIYHSLWIKSEVVVFHETTRGPFNRDETIFAPWSPVEQDKDAVEVFQGKMIVSCSELIKHKA